MKKWKYMSRKKLETTAQRQHQDIERLQVAIAKGQDAHRKCYAAAEVLAVVGMVYLDQGQAGELPDDTPEGEFMAIAKQMNITLENHVALYGKIEEATKAKEEPT